MSVKVILNPSNTPKEKAQISWNGGNSVANDKLKITQSKKMKNEGSFTISASVSADSGSTGSSSSGSTQSQTKETKKVVKLYVFNNKPVKDMEVVFEPSNEVKRNDSIATGVFGKAESNSGFTIKNEVIYYETNNFKFTCEELINYPRQYGIKSYKVDFPSSLNGPVLLPVGYNWGNRKKDEVTIRAVAKIDLNPGNYCRPQRSHYWVSSITERHEKFHLDDWAGFHKPEVINQIALIKVPLSVENLKDFSKIYQELSRQFNVALTEAFKTANKEFRKINNGKDHEGRAYADGKFSYQSIVDAL